MHRRLWFLAGAAAALLLSASSASAGSRLVSAARGAESAAAPFAESWAQVPRTTAARRASRILVFGEEQDVNGFNTALACCNQLATTFLGAGEALHGAFNQSNRGVWFKDLVSKASATRTSLSYTIKPNANWYWGGRKVPVTYEDFVYTLQQIDDPSSLAGRAGYANIDTSNWTHRGLKQVTFHWKTTNCTSDFPCGPYANWQRLFSTIYPSFALAGQDFNRIWTGCICGSDGQPVADGPFYLANYTKGEGTTLKANPYWGGRRPGLREIDIKIITSTDAEVRAMRTGEIDAITPTFGANLLPLKGVPGIVFSEVPGYYDEHLDFREGRGSSNPLLRSPWMRQAISLALDRQGIIDVAFGQLAGRTKPLNNMIFYSTQAPYRPDFAKWSYNPKAAIALLRRHCTGGPRKPGGAGTWTCSGYPARFRWAWTSGITPRAITEAIAKQELREVGIDISDDPQPANVIFGPTGIPGGDFDIAEYSRITSGDPADFFDAYRCDGAGNYTGYCSIKATKLMQAANAQLNPAKRAKEFQAADRILAASVPELPLYQRPDALIYKTGILGMRNSPGIAGPFWNVQDWRWRS
jgi:glutathione transport system substrate-binding protein